MARKMGTGQPDPTKDRSAHEAARGVKKVTMRDLARQLPSEDDLSNYHDRMNDESDRGAAVLAAALVERALEDAIRSKLIDPGDGTADEWFEGINAPFRTFSAKISLARALDIIDARIEDVLSTVKDVRNVFAHGMISLDFNHPTIAKECQKLRPQTVSIDDYAPRQLFGVSCLTLARGLGMSGVLKSHLKPTRFERSNKKD
jgi:hypothetical protein